MLGIILKNLLVRDGFQDFIHRDLLVVPLFLSMLRHADGLLCSLPFYLR